MGVNHSPLLRTWVFGPTLHFGNFSSFRLLAGTWLVLFLGACPSAELGEKSECPSNSIYSSGSCVCLSGFSGTSPTCVDIDECLELSATCDTNATCTNIPGSFECACNTGFVGDGKSCSDVDECLELLAGCDINATCTNTSGSFECVCNPGFVGDGTSCAIEHVCPNGFCSADEDPHSCFEDCGTDLSVIVDAGLFDLLADSLNQYREDLENAGFKIRTMAFSGGTAFALRELLISERNSHNIRGAFLIGNLPAAWYEQSAFYVWEEFPIDLYFMDLDASWYDTNNNQRFDGHTTLGLDIFTSRLTGSLNKLQTYFARLHTYKTSGPLVPQAGFLFVDDDWYGVGEGGLDSIYSGVTVYDNSYQTTRSAYINQLSGPGAEFIFQLIHSSPNSLFINDPACGSTLPAYCVLYNSDLLALNPKTSFYNLFNCSAARFTESEPCLAQTYVVETSFGLAAIGSTKTGGLAAIYYNFGTPAGEVFNTPLGQGKTWGESFLNTYAVLGPNNDEWMLGMTLIGDPLLRVYGQLKTSLQKASTPPAWTPERVRAFYAQMVKLAQQTKLGTFDEYKLSQPQFFNSPAPNK